jgi:hypothetical protein
VSVALYPTESSSSVSGIHLCLRLSKIQGLKRLEGLGKLEKNISDIIGDRTPDLSAYGSSLQA